MKKKTCLAGLLLLLCFPVAGSFILRQDGLGGLNIRVKPVLPQPDAASGIGKLEFMAWLYESKSRVYELLYVS